jgi:hypothetical protein
MRVRFTHDETGAGIATYTTDWHVRDGVRVLRCVVISRRFAHASQLGRSAVAYTIRHVERTEGGAERVLLDNAAATFADALDVLGRELSRLVASGFARKADLERVPMARRRTPRAPVRA